MPAEPHYVRWIVVLLLGSLAFSAIIGFAGAANTFDWLLAAGAGTAFGTVILAGFTGALAFATSIDVRATRDIADLTRRDQEIRSSPVVLVYTQGFSDGLRVVVANSGLSPAINVRISADYHGAGRVAAASDLVIPYIRAGGTPDEHVLHVNTPEPPPGGIRYQDFSLTGTCADVTGTRTFEVIALRTE